MYISTQLPNPMSRERKKITSLEKNITNLPYDKKTHSILCIFKKSHEAFFTLKAPQLILFYSVSLLTLTIFFHKTIFYQDHTLQIRQYFYS
jgi:hypothetical protein